MSTEGAGYETFTLVWEGLTIEVSHQANWLDTGHWHIELRCDDPLPVTQTGYRSYFVPSPAVSGQADITACVIGWLDDAAQTPEWRKHLTAAAQLKLF